MPLPPPFAVAHQNAQGQTVAVYPCDHMAAVHVAVTTLGVRCALRPGDRLFIDFYEPPKREDEG